MVCEHFVVSVVFIRKTTKKLAGTTRNPDSDQRISWFRGGGCGGCGGGGRGGGGRGGGGISALVVVCVRVCVCL